MGTSSNYHRFVDRIHPEHYRAREVQKLRHAIQAKENRLVIGIPEIGISNLLRFLVTRAVWDERQVIFAYLDCGALDDCLDQEMFFGEIARQFAEQGQDCDVAVDITGFARLNRILLRGEGHPQDRLVVIATKLDRMVMAADESLYRKLKALTDLNKRLCFIFSVGLPVTDQVDPAGLLFAGRKLMVGPFVEQDISQAILQEADRLGVAFSPLEQRELVRLTGGHPGLLRATTSAMVDDALDLSDLDNTRQQLQGRGDVSRRCRRIWQALKPDQQTALSRISRRQTVSGLTETIHTLQELGLVIKDNEKPGLFSLLFQDFVRNQNIELDPAEEETKGNHVWIDRPSKKIVGDQEIVVSGKVFKGNTEVHVTALELRLIACLTRENKIYTKDEIAQYVYYDEEGVVQDGRIENLVRQVRKCLGNSEYIKTYWKRGYEFIDAADGFVDS